MQAGGGLFVAPKKDHKKLTLKKYKMDRHHSYTMAKKRRFTTEIIARNILRKFFVSLIWSLILMITITI